MEPEAARRLQRAAARVWVEFAVDLEAFASYLRDREVEAAAAEPHAGDLYLACACLRGDPAALAIFEQRYLSLVPAFVARVAQTADLVDEVQQRLRQRLLVADGDRPAKLADYAGRGKLSSWLRVVAVRVALELQRGRKVGVESDDESIDRALPVDDPELEYIRKRYAADFGAAFAEALEQLESRPRTVLRMHLVDGLNIDKIGELFDVHRATVARWLADTRQLLFEQTRQLLHQRLGVSASEFQSLAVLVRSEMNASIRRILSEKDE